MLNPNGSIFQDILDIYYVNGPRTHECTPREYSAYVATLSIGLAGFAWLAYDMMNEGPFCSLGKTLSLMAVAGAMIGLSAQPVIRIGHVRENYSDKIIYGAIAAVMLGAALHFNGKEENAAIGFFIGAAIAALKLTFLGIAGSRDDVKTKSKI